MRCGAGEELLKDGFRVITHGSTGTLATAGHGTAMGVLKSAVAGGKFLKIYLMEGRPTNNGACRRRPPTLSRLLLSVRPKSLQVGRPRPGRR